MLHCSRGLHFKGRSASIKRHLDFIEMEVKTATQYLGFLMTQNQEGKEGVTLLAQGIDRDYQGKLGGCSTMEVMKCMYGIQDIMASFGINMSCD